MMWSATLLEITIEGKAYKFDPSKLMNTEIRGIQKLFGLKVSDFQKIDLTDIDVSDAIVWLIRTRDGEVDLKPEDIVYDFASLQVRDLDAPAETESDSLDPSEQQPSEPLPLTPDMS
jgi:hypothetical protein